jgi:hypothetical protein
MREHGKPGTYTSGGCRCDLCREAIRRHKAERKAKANPERAAQSKECEVCQTRFNRHQWETGREWARRRLCSKSCVGVVAASNRPHSIGRRRLLAATCTKCGVLHDGRKFQVSKNGTAHVCSGCRRVRQLARPGALEKHRQGAREREKRINDQSRPGAHRGGMEWTGVELEVVSRRDLTRAEMARALGRTISAVSQARTRVRKDPKWASIAGLPQASIDPLT